MKLLWSLLEPLFNSPGSREDAEVMLLLDAPSLVVRCIETGDADLQNTGNMIASTWINVFGKIKEYDRIIELLQALGRCDQRSSDSCVIATSTVAMFLSPEARSTIPEKFLIRIDEALNLPFFANNIDMHLFTLYKSHLGIQD